MQVWAIQSEKRVGIHVWIRDAVMLRVYIVNPKSYKALNII